MNPPSPLVDMTMKHTFSNSQWMCLWCLTFKTLGCQCSLLFSDEHFSLKIGQEAAVNNSEKLFFIHNNKPLVQGIWTYKNITTIMLRESTKTNWEARTWTDVQYPQLNTFKGWRASICPINWQTYLSNKRYAISSLKPYSVPYKMSICLPSSENRVWYFFLSLDNSDITWSAKKQKF